jgi:PAS domain S-box-containing protein
MKIIYKLMLGFLVIAFMIWIVGYFAVSTSQKALQKAIEDSSVFLAVKIMDEIDKNTFRRIEEFNAYSKNLIVQEAVWASNQRFNNLNDVETYINEKDQEWTSTPKEVITPFMVELIDNKLSRSLKEKLDYYKKKYGYRVFSEVIITNKYGANVALSGKITDYKQDDEQWWQKGKSDATYIGDVEYDESTGAYVTTFGIRIDDDNGNFIGVMKVALNIKDVNYIIKDFESVGTPEERKTTYKLVTKEGRVIYSTGEFKILEDVHDYIEHIEDGEPGGHKQGVFVRNDKKHGGVLCAHTHSNFKELDWILLVEHKTKEIFAPVVKLRNGILVTSIIVTILAVLISISFSRSISKPVTKLRDAAIKIGRGDLDTKIEVKTKDEIGQLATSFKKMSEDLKATTVSKEYVDNIMDSMIDTLIVVDSDGKIKTVNRATCKLLGYKEEELIGKPVESISESRELFLEERKLEELIDDGKVVNYETVYKTKQGDNIPMLFSGSVITDKDGAINYIVCTASDITERKRAEEALRESEEKYRTITGTAQDAIVMMDEQGDISYWNPAAERIFGYAPEEVIGKELHLLLGPQRYHQAYKKGFKTFRETGRGPALGKTLEFSAIRRDGTEFPIELSVTGIQIKGKRHATGIIRDITERKQAEEKLQRYAEELRAKNEEVRAFAYIVSHDLRAPLINLKGFSDELTYSLKEGKTLLDKCIAHIDEKDRDRFTTIFEQDVPEALEFITSSVSRMDSLINAILKLSRIERRELTPVPINMEELVKPILKSLTHQVGQHRGKVAVGALPEVVADKTTMEQIMGNLLDNAVKYLDPGRPGKIEISAEGGSEETTFHISDNGRGIAKENLHKVFEIFRRAGKEDVQGEGMGLAYVRTLIRRHGGRIWCESEPDVGTTFSFTIPHKLKTEDQKAA